MKYLIIIFAIISFGLIFTGIILDLGENPLKNKFYGFGISSLFVITIPLFLFWRKDKISIEKYAWKNPKNKVEDEVSDKE